MDFDLSIQESLRGIKVDDGRLMLPPGAAIRGASVYKVLIGAFVLVTSLSFGGAGWLVAVPVTYSIVEAMAQFRARVVATTDEVIVRNRWRTHRIPLHDIRTVQIGTATWTARSPTLAGWTWPIEDDWEVGTIVDLEGRAIGCDALVSYAYDEDRWQLEPSPVEQKVVALTRWIEATRSRPADAGPDHGSARGASDR